MIPHTLCEGDLSVRMLVDGDRAAIEILDGRSLSFDCRTRMLQDVIHGTPLQVSAPQGFCLLERRDSVIRLEFGLAGEGRQACDFPVVSFAAALAS